MALKTCRGCHQMLDTTEFGKRANGHNGLMARCRTCMNARMRINYAKHPELYRKHFHSWRAKNLEYDSKRKAEWHQRVKERNIQKMRAWRQELHTTAISCLGGMCACCGETHQSMLEIDHVHGGGNAERKADNRNNFKTYQRIRDGKAKKGHYQVLCSNCNHSRRRNGGTCEHKTESDTTPRHIEWP